MRFVCHEHGEVDTVSVPGYVLGGYTKTNGPNERDLEDIEFTFGIGEDGEPMVTDADGAEGYLSKFADWEEKVTGAVKDIDVSWRECPECGDPTWLLEDDVEAPEP